MHLFDDLKHAGDEAQSQTPVPSSDGGRASVFSKLLLSWLSPVLTGARRHALDRSSLITLDPTLTPRVCGGELGCAWKQVHCNSPPHPCRSFIAAGIIVPGTLQTKKHAEAAAQTQRMI
jgi:hypothetical protein